jgi:hypothetical protein
VLSVKNLTTIIPKSDCETKVEGKYNSIARIPILLGFSISSDASCSVGYTDFGIEYPGASEALNRIAFIVQKKINWQIRPFSSLPLF